MLLFSSSLLAQERSCGGQGGFCTRNGGECEDNGVADVCIQTRGNDGACQIPCQTEAGGRDPFECSLGEVCSAGYLVSGEPQFFCKPTAFAMDLNLLDSCISHFINGLPAPDFSSGDECSLERNLNKMLDRNTDGEFDIFDVESCIDTFLHLYDDGKQCSCPADSGEFLYGQKEVKATCETDRDCRMGLTCDLTKKVCECDGNYDCVDGEICDPELKTCRFFCTDDSDCGGDGSLVCNGLTNYCECASPSCPDDGEERIFCSVNEDCGVGAFCNTDLHYCQRECGFIVDRASEGSEQILERKCAGNLKLCKLYTGRCEEVDISNSTCEVDSDCPNGAYCFVGECTPHCYTSLDCPDAKWYCNLANMCMPVPKVVSEDVEPFDPLDYAIFLAERTVTLTGMNNEYKVPLLIMNKKTRKQVFDQPNVVFGYRLEVKYQKKQSALCTKDPNELTEEELKDCIIDPDEEFITMENPFGTVYGDGDPTLNIRLNEYAVSLLSPGLYVAHLRAIFNNGDSDEAEIRFVKTSPNGDYVGTLEVYKNGKENSLGEDNLVMTLFVDVDAPQIEWDREVLAPNYLLGEKEYEDRTMGYPVSGYLDGNASVMFANPLAKTRDENEMIPIKGIYSPHLGRMRLISVIELPVSDQYCRSEDGECNDADSRQLKVDNVFNRRIRRKIEFIGPFDFKSGRYSGGYRETLSGLTPSNRDVTLEGDFYLHQVKQDDTKIELEEPLAEPGPDGGSETVGFIERTELMEGLNAAIGFYCESGQRAEGEPPTVIQHFFETEDDYDQYLMQVTVSEEEADARANPIYPRLIRFEGEVGRALDELAGNQGDYLTLAEYLKGSIEFCTRDAVGDRVDENGWVQDDTYEDGETCVDERQIRCGLALYQKALLEMKTEPVPQAECAGEGTCENGQTCNEDDGVCECSSDVQCVCVETEGCDTYCEEDYDCAVGFECNLDTNLCRCEVLTPEQIEAGLTPTIADCECCDGERICNRDTAQCENIENAFINLDTVESSGHFNSYTLFCPELPLPGSDCLVPPAENPSLFTLQEHNRFFKELVQTLSYQAGNDLSDAFYVMYKAYQGDELDADSAYEHKELRYYDALDNYEEMRRAFFEPIPAAVLHQWPMRRFATMGNTFIQYMNTVTNDRLDTLIDLIDLRRRILQDTDESDYVFAHHVLQEEYLTRVYLFLVQQDWQRELFRYTGHSSEMIEKGRNLLNRVNENRNPLGYHPRRVYFENSDITLNNWQNYKKRVEAELVKADEAVSGAITNMQNALRDRDNLESALQIAAHDFDAQLERFCGSPEGYPDQCKVGDEERLQMWKNVLNQSCPANDLECKSLSWECDTFDWGNFDPCGDAVATFADDLDEYGCRITDADPNDWAVETNNALRLCVRGEMGALLQEGVFLETQIEQVFEKVMQLIRNISREIEYLKVVEAENQDLMLFLTEKNEDLVEKNKSLRDIDFKISLFMSATEVGSCLAIFGLASGTSCVGAGLSAAARSMKLGIQRSATKKLVNALEDLQHMKEERLQEGSQTKEIAGLRLQLDNMAAQALSYLQEYELLTQQLYNNYARTEDTYYLAQRTAARYNDMVGSIVDRLIGRESGSVLLRNSLVKESNERFRIVLEETYKMAQAFLYRYNYGAGAEQVVNKVYTLQTLDDVRDFLEELTRKEQEYCGEMGLDCDYKNNQKIFRLSMRETLYPEYRDIYANGRVLTAGQQFHNEITSDFRAVKRRRASGVHKQIELPVRIWMVQGGGATGENEYMVNPEECNHFIVGERNGGAAAQGTVAVNIIGTRLPANIEYELWRNATDYIRSCTEKVSDIENKVEVYQVGWAPQNDFAALDQPDTFLTHSQAFTACQNNWRLEDPNSRNNEDACYNFFARDRSLGTLDTTFVIPFVDGDQSWVYGDGLKDDEKPIIEDIILYFRYNSQPIYSDGT